MSGSRSAVRTGTAPIFMVGHFDTACPVGRLQQTPFGVEDGLVRGPGVFDLKAGLVQALWAVHAVRGMGGRLPPSIFLLNSDQEIGSPTSRALIVEEARRAHVSLVLELACHGALKTARKGVGIVIVEVIGRAAHAGSEPWEGVSAIDEADPTVNVGVFQGGTRGNVVAASARLEVDLRAPASADAERMCSLVQGLKPHHPDAVVRVTGGMNRPRMERPSALCGSSGTRAPWLRSSASSSTRPQSAAVATAIFCVGVNPAVLDGLGAVGDDGHALTEHVQLEHIVPRAALVARLLQTISEV